MAKLKARCDKLLKKVRYSYPILEKDSINILVKEFKYTGFALKIPFTKIHYVILNPKKCGKLSDKALTGVIAHELAHFEQYKKNSMPKMIKILLLYFISDKTRMTFEREAEFIALRKGFGEELLAFRTQKKETKASKYYLSPQEIKKGMR